MAHFTYLLIDVLSCIICFIFSFHKKIRFNEHFFSFLKAALIVGIPFIVWDCFFASVGIWWFNHEYTLGVDILGLPLEEWLFFLCIPFACVFTYYCFDKFFKMEKTNRYTIFVVLAGIAVSIIAMLLYNKHSYTFLTALLMLIVLSFLYFVPKVQWIAGATFIYLLLMAGFIPVNGILTGTGLASPIVNYHPQEIIGWRFLTIPIEDFFYGYVLYLLNVFFFQQFRRIKEEKQTLAIHGV